MRNINISVNRLRFYAYTDEEQYNVGHCLWLLDFTDRRDFLFSGLTSGIAVRIDLTNETYFTEKQRGARRKLKVSLVDITDRVPVCEKIEPIYLTKNDPYGYNVVDFPCSEVVFRPSHSYRVSVTDISTGIVLAEEAFNLFDHIELGEPADWYTVERGFVNLNGERFALRAVKQCDFDCEATFLVSKNIKEYLAVLPELEIRVYPPNGGSANIALEEPTVCRYNSDFLQVKCPFNTIDYPEGVYYAELRCMEVRLAGFVFLAGDDNEAGLWAGDELACLDERTPEAFEQRYRQLTGVDATPTVAPGPEPSMLAPLDHLTGLRSVKTKLLTYERIVRFNKMRTDSGLPTSDTPLHAMFLGAPGTGKTTVAKLMGQMLKRAGVLSVGHVVVRERGNLLGQNYNSEAENTMDAIEKAQGGILFIDEAYSLYQPNDPRDPGKFVIETLLTALADESRRDWMLILAGYPEEMRRMFEMNPGFRSRIPQSNIYVFDDFTEDELMEIAQNYLAEQQYVLTAEAAEALRERLRADWTARDHKFGNARHVLNLIQTEILPAMALRVTEASGAVSLTEILAADIPAAEVAARPRPRIGYTG